MLYCNSLAAINERVVYTIYSNTLADGVDTLSEDYRLILNDIAMQCPVSGGNAVYDAISLINTFYPELYYNMIENCSSNGFKLENELYEEIALQDQAQSNSIIVKPNPTNGKITVFNSSSYPVIFNLYDIKNRLVISSTISGYDLIEISELIELHDGIYIYQLLGEKNEIGKLIKSK